MTWTKVTKATPTDGWGGDSWGSSPWGSPTGVSDWAKQTKSSDSWTNKTKSADTWNKQAKSSDSWTGDGDYNFMREYDTLIGYDSANSTLTWSKISKAT